MISEPVTLIFKGVRERIAWIANEEGINRAVSNEPQRFTWQSVELFPIEREVSGKEDAAPFFPGKGTKRIGAFNCVGSFCEADDEPALKGLKGAAAIYSVHSFERGVSLT